MGQEEIRSGEKTRVTSLFAHTVVRERGATRGRMAVLKERGSERDGDTGRNGTFAVSSDMQPGYTAARGHSAKIAISPRKSARGDERGGLRDKERERKRWIERVYLRGIRRGNMRARSAHGGRAAPGRR